MQIRNLNVAETIVQLEHRVGKLEEVIDRILDGEDLDQETIERIEKELLEDLQEKYPELEVQSNRN